MRRMLWSVAAMLAFAVAARAAEGEGCHKKHKEKDEKIEVKDLPPAVTEAIQKAYPNAKILKAEKEAEDGKVQYSVKLQDGEKKFEVKVSEDGKSLKVDDEDDSKDDGDKEDKDDDDKGKK
jgi:hypothetical protein